MNYSLVTCHRLQQLFSSSPEKSESLQDFRSSANNRMTYKHSIKAAPFTTKTPHRNPKQRYENEDYSIPKEIIERRRNCKGPIICIVPQKEGEKNLPRNFSFAMPELIGGALAAITTSA